MANLVAGYYFNLLFDGLSGWAVLCTFPGNGRYSKERGPTKSHWFYWPKQRDDMVSFILTHENQDVYVVPSLFKTRDSRRASNVSCGKVAYADADACPLDAFYAEPTMYVETSPGRYQAYWVLNSAPEDDSITPDVLAKINRRIAYAHADQGCDTGGWDIGQLLRVPQTRNNKPNLDMPWQVRGKINGVIYNIQELRDAYPPVIEATAHTPERTLPDMTKLPSTAEAVAAIADNATLMDLYSKPCVPGTDDRSARMWRLLSEMSRLGLSIEIAFVVARTAQCNKYSQEGRPIEELWREVCKAYAQPENAHASSELSLEELQAFREIERNLGSIVVESFDTPGESPLDTPPEDHRKPAEQHAFLTDAERLLVPTDTIVDRYVTWARSRTDAATQYQVAGILSVLATVFGDFAYPGTKFRLGGMNLWFMILGGTTRSRKSTARHMMLDTLAMLETDGYTYDLGSDVTGEGLTVELSDHPGRSMLLNRDEVQGLVVETGTKSYLAGLKETLTELYDGRVRGRLRATGTTKKTNSVRTVFSMFLAGITTEVTEHLTTRDFASGFLARFIFVHADPPPRTRQSVYMEQIEEGSAQLEVDFSHEAIVTEIHEARMFWESITHPGAQVPMTFEKNAWRRLNEFNWEIGGVAEAHDLSEVLAPTTDRLVKSTVKVACILAMSEHQTEVAMRHVLKAISLTEDWFSYLLLITSKVRETQWQKEQDEVVKALMAMGEVVNYAKVYDKVAHRFRPREFEQVLEALSATGRIRVGYVNNIRTIKKMGW